MQFNKPEIKSPITREEIEALGFIHIFDEFGGRQTFWNEPPSLVKGHTNMELRAFANNYMRLEVTVGASTGAVVLGTFSDIAHFKSACELAGIQF